MISTRGICSVTQSRSISKEEPKGGQASTIIDLTEPSPLVLRDGPVRDL